MAVKVLITRRFKSGKGHELLGLLNQARSQAMNQPGYITGETLVGRDDPNKLVVIGTWQSEDHWKSGGNPPPGNLWNPRPRRCWKPQPPMKCFRSEAFQPKINTQAITFEMACTQEDLFKHLG
jgi:hypothetical protein